MENSKRWGIALAGIFLQVALGSVYAWSVFRVPLAKQFHWSISQVTLTFTISIFVLGIASFVGGLWLNRSGPRIVALTANATEEDRQACLALAKRIDEHPYWLSLADEASVARIHRALQQASPYPRPD